MVPAKMDSAVQILEAFMANSVNPDYRLLPGPYFLKAS